MTATELRETLWRIERNSLISSKKALTIDDVALLTGWSKSHIYKLTCQAELPHYKPNGKTIYFSKEEIEGFLLRNRIMTREEAEQQAAAAALNPTRKKGGRR